MIIPQIYTMYFEQVQSIKTKIILYGGGTAPAPACWSAVGSSRGLFRCSGGKLPELLKHGNDAGHVNYLNQPNLETHLSNVIY
jgi:hypothetical protein